MLSRFKNVVMGAMGGLEPNGLASLTESNYLRQENLQPKFAYSRPAFLTLSEDEVQMSADHKLRPIIHPSTPLPHHAGYAECVNAGKSKLNEDQAVCTRGAITRIEFHRGKGIKKFALPYDYFALFDGHAGAGASLSAAQHLHHLVHEKLVDALDDIWLNLYCELINNEDPKISTELLIIGALEMAFKEMDQVIAEDKTKYATAGGCTALVALFILGKLYIANAGDSRAIVCNDQDFTLMSMDFTPENERDRIRKLTEEQPQLLGKEFTSREYIRSPKSAELGKTIMYRDPHMTGWAYKTLQLDDLKISVITGQGKRSRVMGTIGVTRGFGDHDLVSVYQKFPIKPLLSCHPEVQVRKLFEATEKEVLVMGTDGLWDVVDGDKATSIVSQSMNTFMEKERYLCAATCLVGAARGRLVNDHTWQLKDKKPSSADDISVFAIPLSPYKIEYETLIEKFIEYNQD